MHLLDIERSGEHIKVHLPLLEQSFKIGLLERVVLGAVCVASTEIAVVLTVGNMYVHTDAAGFIAIIETLDHGLFPLFH